MSHNNLFMYNCSTLKLDMYIQCTYLTHRHPAIAFSLTPSPTITTIFPSLSHTFSSSLSIFYHTVLLSLSRILLLISSQYSPYLHFSHPPSNPLSNTLISTLPFTQYINSPRMLINPHSVDTFSSPFYAL